jgi:hypothetical protein
MKKKKEIVKENLLQKIWSRTEDAWDELKQKRASKSLRVQAEQDLLELQDEVIKNEESFEKTIDKAKDSKDWKSIRKTSLEIKLSQKKLDEAAILYNEFFDKDAKDILEN